MKNMLKYCAAFLISAATALTGIAQEAPAPVSLKITTDPEGATVLINRKRAGTTPLTLKGMPSNRYLVNIEKEGFTAIRRTVPVIKGRTEIIDLKLEPLKGLVLIHSNPSGADIRIDGLDKGKTPKLLTDIPLGKHNVEVNLSGHVGKKLDLTIKDRVPQKLSVELTSDSATLVINSQPSGASVILNGIAKGITPCSVDRIPTGNSVLELTMDGYEPYKKTLKLFAGEREEMTANLTAVPAQLKVVSIPSGARVYINNQFRGNTPVTLKNVAPGPYRIRAELDAHIPMARSINVPRAKEITEEFRFQKNTGLLQIITEPAGVNVFVDKKKLGTTVAKKDQTDRVSEPLIIDTIEAGNHQLILSKKGYFDHKAVVEINKDKTSSLHIPMKRRFIPNYEITTSNGVYPGVYVRTDANGGITIETRPGIFKTFQPGEIRSKRPLRKTLPK